MYENFQESKDSDETNKSLGREGGENNINNNNNSNDNDNDNNNNNYKIKKQAI